jgi:DNA-binding SARP family transcriptional activator
MKLCLPILLLFIPLNLSWGQDVRYGLKFHSYEVEKEKRTGLNLAPGKPFSFPNGFSMSFDINFSPERLHPFGSVFRIVAEDRQHIDFMLSEIGNTGKTMVSFISSSGGIVFEQAFGEEIDYGRFVAVQIQIDIRRGTLSATVGNKRFARQAMPLESFRNSRILFGKSNYPRFQTTDVPSFILRNIQIRDAAGKPLYQWTLSRHAQGGAYDELKNHFAQCENPEWILDSHAFWQKQMEFEVKTNPHFCYNPDKNEVAVFDQDTFIRFCLDSGTLIKNKVANKLIHTASSSNNLVYNPFTKTYNCAVFNLRAGVDLLVYDTLAGDWNKAYDNNLPPDYWHHNRFFSALDSNLYLMNGYGHHKYKNTVNRYDYRTKTWDTLSLRGDRIHPRYLGGLAKKDELHLILFGGYGSETGNQEIRPQSYYDLYEIDLQTLEAKKVWEMDAPPSPDFAVANSLVPSAGGQTFYALTFPNHRFYSKLSLLEVSMNRPEYRIVADSIPFDFEDVRSNADLYFSPSSGLLIAVVVEPLTSASSRVAIYTLHSPPLALDELCQTGRKRSLWPVLLFSALGLAGAWLAAGAVSSRLKKRKTERRLPGEAPKGKTPPGEQPPGRRQAICLLGGFRVFDANGTNLAKEFTPMLRQLFALLLLSTAKNGSGISSAKLRDTLWFDKSEKNARNNRGVFINKLRQIFGQPGPVHIKNHDLYWSLEVDGSVYCDYLEALRLIRKLSLNKKTASAGDVKELLSIASAGELLPDMQNEWVDGFKSDFSNSLIDLLLDVYKQSDVRKSLQLCINLADVIFIHDSLNEDALSIKCRQLSLMGKYGLAQKVYAIFVKEYKTLLNADFKYTFEQLIRREELL